MERGVAGGIASGSEGPPRCRRGFLCGNGPTRQCATILQMQVNSIVVIQQGNPGQTLTYLLGLVYRGLPQWPWVVATRGTQYERGLRVDEILALVSWSVYAITPCRRPGQVAAEINWRCVSQYNTRERLVGQPCRKGTLFSIAKILSSALLCFCARTGGQRKMRGRPFGYAHVSVVSDADANNFKTQRPALADCEQVFKDVGSGGLGFPDLICSIAT